MYYNENKQLKSELKFFKIMSAVLLVACLLLATILWSMHDSYQHEMYALEHECEWVPVGGLEVCR